MHTTPILIICFIFYTPTTKVIIHISIKLITIVKFTIIPTNFSLYSYSKAKGTIAIPIGKIRATKSIVRYNEVNGRNKNNKIPMVNPNP